KHWLPKICRSYDLGRRLPANERFWHPSPADGPFFPAAEIRESRGGMIDVTQILSQIESGDPSAAEQLLPLVYEELRKLAAAKFVQEKPGQTLQATSLVHEAYVRLVDVEKVQHWNSRGHFFAAAAEAMRRILIESVRRKQSRKHGGDYARVELSAMDVAAPESPEEVLALDEAMQKLAK